MPIRRRSHGSAWQGSASWPHRRRAREAATDATKSMLTVKMVSDIEVWLLCWVRRALSIMRRLLSACTTWNRSSGRQLPRPNRPSTAVRDISWEQKPLACSARVCSRISSAWRGGREWTRASTTSSALSNHCSIKSLPHGTVQGEKLQSGQFVRRWGIRGLGIVLGGGLANEAG